MPIRRLLVAFASVAAMAVSGLALATPAHAATTHNVTVSCDGGFGTPMAFTPTSLSVSSGDTVVITNTGLTNPISINNWDGLMPVFNPPGGSLAANGGYMSGTAMTTGTTTLNGLGQCSNGGITITVGGGGGGGGSSTSSSGSGSGPAPVMQQFGKPATGTCDEAQPEGLDWAGVPSGGWTTTWGGWMNDNAGGWVCSRTLSYSSSLAKWVVN